MIQHLESFISDQISGDKTPENTKTLKIVKDGVSFIESWWFSKCKDPRLSQLRRNF